MTMEDPTTGAAVPHNDNAIHKNEGTTGNDNEEEEMKRLVRRAREEAMERMLLAQEEKEDAAASGGQQQQEQHDEAAADNNQNAVNNPINQADPFEEAENNPEQQPQAAPVAAGGAATAPPTKRISYTKASFTAAFALLFYALRTRQQWYLALVYLSSSKWAAVLLGNALVAATVKMFDLTVNTFLTGLRVQEAEDLQDFFRWNVTETCLALTMFRSELSVSTACEFLVLILVKCLHQIAILRESHLRMTQEAIVGYTGSSPFPPQGWPVIPVQHLKLLAMLILLQLLDLWAVQYTGMDIAARGPSVSILFAFEAAILLVSAWSHVLLWHLHVLDGWLHFGHEHGYRLASRWIHPWKEYKATLTFAVELQAQSIQFLFYLTFFAIVLTYYGMPINLFREVYMSFSALKERLLAFYKYRRLMASMNRFANVTEEQLAEQGRVCIICRDEMTTADAKMLPGCHHCFHKSCLREWLVQQQSCPTCRADIATMQAQETARQTAAAAAAQRDQDEQAAAAAAGAGAGAGTSVAPAPVGAASGGPALTEPNAAAVPPSGANQGAISAASVTGAVAASPETNYKLEKKVVRFADHVSTGVATGVSRTITFPALYRVVRDEGAPVYNDGRDFCMVIRTVPFGVLVYCQGMEERTLPRGELDDVTGGDGLGEQKQDDGDGKVLTKTTCLRIPDGWIPEDSALRCLEL